MMRGKEQDTMTRNTGHQMEISGHLATAIPTAASGDICIITEATTGITLTRMVIW